MSWFAIFIFVAVFLSVLLVFAGIYAATAAKRKMTGARLSAITASKKEAHKDVLEAIMRDETLSDSPWLDGMLRRADFTEWLRLRLAQADSSWPVATLLIYSFVWSLGLATLCYWRTESLAASFVAGVLGAALPFGYIERMRTKRLKQFERRLPEALDMMVSAIRAGHGIQSAIGMVATETAAPISTEFRICHDEHSFGMDFRDAMDNLTKRVPLHDVQIMATAILIQKESGGNLAEIVEKVAHIIRERFRLRQQIQVHTAQGRLTGWILALLPVVLGFAIFLVNPVYMSTLWGNPLGVQLIWASCIMTLIGALIIRKIINVKI